MTESKQRSRTYSRRRKWIEALALIVGSTLSMFALTGIAVVIYNNSLPDAMDHVLEIPPGSSILIDEGENPLRIPTTWSFFVDDTLVLDNRDDVSHTIGTFVVPSNDVGRLDLLHDVSGYQISTLHPDGGFVLDVQSRELDLAPLGAVVLGFGIAIGVLLWIGLIVMRALDEEPDASEIPSREGEQAS